MVAALVTSSVINWQTQNILTLHDVSQFCAVPLHHTTRTVQVQNSLMRHINNNIMNGQFISIRFKTMANSICLQCGHYSIKRTFKATTRCYLRTRNHTTQVVPDICLTSRTLLNRTERLCTIATTSIQPQSQQIHPDNTGWSHCQQIT